MGAYCDLAFRVDPATSIANSTTDFFTAKKFGGNAKICSFSVSLDTAVKLYIRAGLSGGTQYNSVFNSDTALTANALYSFTFVVDPSCTYTFRTSAACVVNNMAGVLSFE